MHDIARDAEWLHGLLGGPGRRPGTRRMRTVQTILLATDLSEATNAATEHAIDLSCQLGARLLVMNVLERGRLIGGGSHDRVDQARSERESKLVEVVRAARDAGATAEFMVWDGDPGDTIVNAAAAEGADMVVVGTRGRSTAGRLLLGSVSDHVIRQVDGPVLVVRSSGALVSDAEPLESGG